MGFDEPSWTIEAFEITVRASGNDLTGRMEGGFIWAGDAMIVGVSGSDSARGSPVVGDAFVDIACLWGRANPVNSIRGPKRRPREPRVLSGKPAEFSSSSGGMTVVLKIMRSHLH